MPRVISTISKSRSGGGPVGDTRQPDTELYGLACALRDDLFRVDASRGYSKQCDKCHGWPLLDHEPQTTDLTICARSQTFTAFRAVVLEQYWECANCAGGNSTAKCDWCCEKFPDLETCNYQAHDDPGFWQEDLVDAPEGQCIADAGLRGVKYLSLGCKTRWTNIYKADKIIQANCPACGISYDIDRESEYREFIVRHRKVCDGVPEQWLALAANPTVLEHFFKEDAGRSGLRTYQHKATEVVQKLLQEFNPDDLPDEIQEAQLERKRKKLALPAAQDESIGAGSKRLRLTWNKADELSDEGEEELGSPKRFKLRLTLPRAASRKRRMESGSSEEDEDQFMEERNKRGDEVDHDEDPGSFDQLVLRNATPPGSPTGHLAEDVVDADSGPGPSSPPPINVQSSPSHDMLQLMPYQYKAHNNNRGAKEMKAKQKRKYVQMKASLEATIRSYESDMNFLRKRNAELEKQGRQDQLEKKKLAEELALERMQRRRVHGVAERLRKMVEVMVLPHRRRASVQKDEPVKA